MSDTNEQKTHGVVTKKISNAELSTNDDALDLSSITQLSNPDDSIPIDMLCKMINLLTVGIFIINDDGVIEVVNAYAAKLFGMSKDALIGRKWSDFLNDCQRDEYLQLFDNLKNAKEESLSHGPKEITLNNANGTPIPADLSLSCLPYRQTQKTPMFIGVFHDLTSHKAEYKKLRRLANTDHLTGLANRHAFEHALNQHWMECVTNKHPISILIIDIDYFKQFNDKYGHVNGDKCLKKVAKAIDECVPSRDCVTARYGGEEFAMILPRCSANLAEAVAKHVRRKINALMFVNQGLPAGVNVTVSQGIACEQSGRYNRPEALLYCADMSLYKAKSSGRDRIQISYEVNEENESSQI